MSLSFTRPAIRKCSIVVVAVTTGFALASTPSYAQEQEELCQLFVTPPENVRAVWFLQARHVASELQLERQDRGKLMRTYISARQEHLDKIKALPQTAESFREFHEITGEAESSLEKSLVEAIGKEKGGKAAAALWGSGFFYDHIVADIVAVQDKAVGSVLKYRQSFNRVMKEAREAGSYEGLDEKLEGPHEELMRKVIALYSEEQLTEWEKKYGWFFERIPSP